MFKKTKKQEVSQESKQSIPFVGRETELTCLDQALQATIDTKRPKVILIEGDFGVGKTTLVEHFLNQIAQEQPSVIIGKGVCASETEMSGLSPFSQLLGSFKIRLTPDKWLEFIKNVAPAWIDIFTFNIIGNTLKTIEEGKKLLGKNNYRQENVFVQFANALLQLAKKQPLIAFLDDLQWADVSSLDLLAHLARYLKDAAILVVCAYRPEAKETCSNAKQFNELCLKLLRDDTTHEMQLRQGIDVAAYLNQRYPRHAFSSALITQIQQVTNGHPLFLTQLFALWQETGVIVATVDTEPLPLWRLADENHLELAIPTRIQTVLEHRLRLMGDDLRKIAVSASVEGEEFTAQVLAHLNKLEEGAVYDHLSMLEHRYWLIQEQETKEYDETVVDIYRFTHRFFRDYLYGSLDSGKRRTLHKAVGECLERLYHRNLYPIAGQLALHFREARQPKKAAKYAMMAAQFEQSRYAWAECQAWCELGLSLLKSSQPDTESTQLQFDLLILSAEAYNNSGNNPQSSIQRYETALELIPNLQIKRERVVHLYVYLAFDYYLIEQLELMKQYFASARHILNTEPIPYGEIHIELEVHYAIIQCFFGKNRIVAESLLKLLPQIKNLPATHTLSDNIAETYNILGWSLSELSDYENAITHFRQAIEICQKIGEKTYVVYMSNLALCYFHFGKFEQGIDTASEAFKIASQVGNLNAMQYSKSVKGRILIEIGKPSEALQELKEAKFFLEEGGVHWNISFYMLHSH